MKKRTEAQKNKRAEDIEDGFYAVNRCRDIRYLQSHIPQKYPRFDELNELAAQMHTRAADMILKAFGGEINGRKFWPPKKGRKKS